MISVGTKLIVTDNTGAKEVQCIRIIKKKRYAYISDKIIVSIKKTISSSKVKQGEVLTAIIVRSKKGINRRNGMCIKFVDNAVVLINKEGGLLGTRIFGVIPLEIKNKKYSSIISIAKEVI
jgi:large subunit ribosomal protein L14